MKLPSGQNSPQPSSVNPSQKLAVEKSSAQAAQILARLNNTWVKVEKSEPLTKEQSQQALANSALNGRNTSTNQTSHPKRQTEQSQHASSNSALNDRDTTNKQIAQPKNQAEQTNPPPASPHNEKPLGETDAKQLNTLKSQLQALNDNRANTLTSQLKLNLLTLRHNSGSIRLLSPQSYPINSEVLIKQDAQGAWALQMTL